MIIKTVRTFRQRRPSWRGSKLHENEMHIEAYRRSTWWLFGVIPIYTHDTLVGNNL